ncbi:transmembrane protein 200C-like [Cottoperca gobio]|uniref:Transmembrane protein 200C-like n=1 Tax=Cottoperca gobio TaxID=56716 RepID=A0A6J2PG55_COTGO|nr:transmembrane protein 200C-like [Cottoperca gobio]
MIATGGLLRINARRQDSLRSKTHKAHTHKKNKKKRRNEVVVVKGKLKLFSVSGLVATLGILVLLVGVVMAALGYWPRDGLFFSAQPQEGAAMASMSSSSSIPADVQGGEVGEEIREDEARETGDDGFNRTEIANGTTRQLTQGFLEDFLDKYLFSDRLKVFGPLIMGIGIFLFICANAVLHENRDKKTKVINLRDIYSTVIDLHSLRKPNTSSAANPLNGLVNYVQSKSLEIKPRAYPASLLSRREGGGGQPLTGRGGSDRGGDGGGDGEGEEVFSIFQEQPGAPPPPSSHRLSLPPSFSPPHLSLQKEVLSSFTLPLRRPRPATTCRRHSARAGMGWGGEEERRSEGEEEEEEYVSPPPPQNSSAASCSSSSLHREAPGGSLSHLLSSSSLSHLLSSSSSSTPAPPCRRRSLPTGGSAAGYSKLTYGEDESFESTSSQEVLQQGEAEDDLTGSGPTNQELTQ